MINGSSIRFALSFLDGIPLLWLRVSDSDPSGGGAEEEEGKNGRPLEAANKYDRRTGNGFLAFKWLLQHQFNFPVLRQQLLFPRRVIQSRWLLNLIPLTNAISIDRPWDNAVFCVTDSGERTVTIFGKFVRWNENKGCHGLFRVRIIYLWKLCHVPLLGWLPMSTAIIHQSFTTVTWQWVTLYLDRGGGNNIIIIMITIKFITILIIKRVNISFGTYLLTISLLLHVAVHLSTLLGLRSKSVQDNLLVRIEKVCYNNWRDLYL